MKTCEAAIVETNGSLREIRRAVFSDCERYRYQLEIKWDMCKCTVAFIGLNPSTADEHKDDPTVRRCKNFARAWGYSGMVMLNLFAFRSTDPKGMLNCEDPVGPENDEEIEAVLANVKEVVCAWGCNGSHRGRDREFLALPFVRSRALACLKTTGKGYPYHPLYLSKSLMPVTYRLPNTAKEVAV